MKVKKIDVPGSLGTLPTPQKRMGAGAIILSTRYVGKYAGVFGGKEEGSFGLNKAHSATKHTDEMGMARVASNFLSVPLSLMEQIPRNVFKRLVQQIVHANEFACSYE